MCYVAKTGRVRALGSGRKLLYVFEGYALDTDRREIRRTEVVIAVEPQVFDLLEYLIRERHRVVSKDDLLATVWNGRIVSESTLASRINAARKAIGDDGTQQRLIRTLHRNGFRFVGAVREEQERPSKSGISDPLIVRPGRLSLVVVPSISNAADEELGCLCKGMADDLAVALIRARSFDVIAHDRVCRIDKEPGQIARECGAAYLIVCRLRKLDHQVRLNVHLVDSRFDTHAWAGSYTYDPDACFADVITAKIAAAVEPSIYASEASRHRGKPLRALDGKSCVLMALSITRERTRQSYITAEQLLTRAVELEPHCGRAHSVAAYFHGLQVLWGWKPRQQTIPLAIEAAHKALALDEQDAWGHFALGFALTQNRLPEPAIEEYQRATAINPYFPSAYACLGLALAYSGQIEKGLAALDEGERLDAPEIFVGITNSARAGLYACAEKSDDAIKAARRSTRQSPGLVGSQRNLVVNCALAGSMEEARSEFKTFLELVPNSSLESIASALPYINDNHLNRTLDAFRLLGAMTGTPL